MNNGKCFECFSKIRDYVRMASKPKIVTNQPGIHRPVTNGAISSDEFKRHMSDAGSDVSNNSERKLICRNTMICSEGNDKYTYDCEQHIQPPLKRLELNGEALRSASALSLISASDQASTPSDGEYSPMVKRESFVHPGKVELQRSLCINGRFHNPWPNWRPPTVTNILKFGLSKDKSNVPSKQELDLVLPILKPKFSEYSMPPEEGVRVTWLGHATVLVQLDGMTILTDPIFSERASPSQVVGPKRYRDVPCSIHDLPPIHAVVISHTHYDHLDLNTVILLNSRFGSDLRWFVPLGLAHWMNAVGCENVVELDWWEENVGGEHSEISFVLTPCQHWCKRTITDDNKVLWGSWSIIGPRNRFFFAGDTGYCDAFKQIGQMYGPFDLSAIPVGAYEPRWFMKYQHVNPEEAVQVHMDVKSLYSLAIHWGTFSLANEYYLDPPIKLRESLEKHNLKPEVFFTLKHGESRVVGRSPSRRYK